MKWSRLSATFGKRLTRKCCRECIYKVASFCWTYLQNVFDVFCFPDNSYSCYQLLFSIQWFCFAQVTSAGIQASAYRCAKITHSACWRPRNYPGPDLIWNKSPVTWSTRQDTVRYTPQQRQKGLQDKSKITQNFSIRQCRTAQEGRNGGLFGPNSSFWHWLAKPGLKGQYETFRKRTTIINGTTTMWMIFQSVDVLCCRVVYWSWHKIPKSPFQRVRRENIWAVLGFKPFLSPPAVDSHPWSHGPGQNHCKSPL